MLLIDKVTQTSALAELTSVNPYLTIAKFVFADDQPCENGWGIEEEDFDDIIKSSIGMPVKMKYLEAVGAEAHMGAVPIGVIQKMEKVKTPEGVNQLVATAGLWNQEYPDEVKYLKDAYADNKAPGISYEIGYHESVLKQGIQWLKKLVTEAAAFVRDPAYGTRTSLLALASIQNDEERKDGILAMAKDLSKPPVRTKGGNKVDDDLKKAQAEAVELQGKITALEKKATDLETRVTTLETENTTLSTENENLKKTALAESRAAEYIAAGFTFDEDAAKAAAKKATLASFTQEQWPVYLDDLKALKATTPATSAQASASAGLPKLTSNEQPVDLTELREGVRGLSRGETAGS